MSPTTPISDIVLENNKRIIQTSIVVAEIVMFDVADTFICKVALQLAKVRLADGRDAGQVLIHEGMAQAWPNTGNRWCGR